MEDVIAVRREAALMVRRHGSNAPAILYEAAELAASRGDALSEEAWRDIALAAESELARLDPHRRD